MFRARTLLILGLSTLLGIQAAVFAGQAHGQSLPACWSPTNGELLIDVELEQDGLLATWQEDPQFLADGTYVPGSVCVAQIDAGTGNLLLDQQACPEGAHPRDRTDTANGPEWGRSLVGPESFFSAYPLDPTDPTGVNLHGIQIRKLSLTGGTWQAYDAAHTLARGRVRPNIDRSRPSARFHMREFLNCQPIGCDATARAFWRFDTNSNAEYPLPDGTRRARWLEDSAIMTFLRRNLQDSTIIEAVAYSTVREREEVVVADARDKSHVLIFEAPEYGNRMTVIVNVRDPSTGVFNLEVYVRVGGRWRLQAEVANISDLYPTLNSPEVFVFNGESYVSATSTGRIDGELQSIVWVAGIENGVRQIVSENLPTQKVDPEPLVLPATAGAPSRAIVYYIDAGTGDLSTWRYLACETGL